MTPTTNSPGIDSKEAAAVLTNTLASQTSMKTCMQALAAPCQEHAIRSQSRCHHCHHYCYTLQTDSASALSRARVAIIIIAKKLSILPSASESNKSRKTSTATTTPWPCSKSKLAEMQLPENSTIEIAAGGKKTESLCKIQSQHPRIKQASKKAIILLCVETKNRGRELVVAAARNVARRRRFQSANLVEGKARSRSKIREIGWRALSSVWRHFHHFRFSLLFFLFSFWPPSISGCTYSFQYSFFSFFLFLRIQKASF